MLQDFCAVYPYYVMVMTLEPKCLSTTIYMVIVTCSDCR